MSYHLHKPCNMARNIEWLLERYFPGQKAGKCRTVVHQAKDCKCLRCKSSEILLCQVIIINNFVYLEYAERVRLQVSHINASSNAVRRCFVGLLV